MRDYVDIDELIGKTFTDVKIRDYDSIVFTLEDGSYYVFNHHQDCCESVAIEDINGSLDDLIGTPIINATKDTNSEDKMGKELYESFTWTFYNFRTIKGYVTVRWLGESNGWYGEEVAIDFYD